MNKVGLTAVLLAPVAIVGVLGVYAYDQAGVRRAKIAAAAQASHTTLAYAGAGRVEAVAAAQAEPKMVRPESLPQGFVLVVKDLTGLANANSPIHLASSHNGWNPGDPKQKLEMRSDLRWQIVLPQPKTDAPLSFKFARGNWDLEELDAELKSIPNRELPLVDASKLGKDEKPIFEFEVPKWGDQRPDASARPDLDPYFRIEATGTVRRLEVAGGGVPFKRDLLVWLPPGYDDAANKDRRYPVLYLQDGQNLFMKMPNTPDEWRVDETATRLIAEKAVEPVIIVGIPHAGAGRMSEYLPLPLVEGAEPRARQYVEFLVGEVMPRVERAFRVKTGPEHTAIGGASLGAVVSLYAATERPDKFGSVLLESMSGLGEKRQALEYFSRARGWPKRVYFAMSEQEAGTDEKAAATNAAYVAGAKAFGELIAGKVSENDRLILIAPGVHNEEAWRDRFPGALKFLFPAKP
jgi:enterochelin esterase-like enzyme